jgi:2-oxoglutarate ferredoxin oxidoreductase subunit beta
MDVVFEKTSMLTDVPFHYCPGCSHGIVHRIIGEVLEELGIGDKTIGVAPVGCAVMSLEYFNCDMQEAAHGRAPAVATGIKRVHPDKIVFSYQGDGDLASIGTAETVHIAARGENITTIFINNAIYGMTGGQMAPTTLFDQKTTTSPKGRTPSSGGYPLKIAEMLATIDGAAFIARVSTHDVKHIIETKKMIKRAFEIQMAGKGYSLVEVLSTCPTNWGMTAVQSINWVRDSMIPNFPLGVKKEVD